MFDVERRHFPGTRRRQSHPDCILRAGTPEAVLYDDEILHWGFGAEDSETLLVQAIKGKRVMGELFLMPEPVAYVKGEAGDREGEFVFECVAETETDRIVTFSFVPPEKVPDTSGVGSITAGALRPARCARWMVGELPGGASSRWC